MKSRVPNGRLIAKIIAHSAHYVHDLWTAHHFRRAVADIARTILIASLDSASALLLCMCHAVALAHPSANQENPQLAHQRRRECGGHLPQTARGPHGGSAEAQNSRQKENPGRHVPPPAQVILARISDSYHAIRCSLSADAVSPTLFRQSRCQGGCDQGWWCPFYGRFHKKIGVVDGQGRGLILVAPLTQHGPGYRTGSQA
jgi:hypothetical protein